MSRKAMRLLLVLILIVAVVWVLSRDALRRVEPVAEVDSALPCHVYKEHRKNVDADATVPVLRDQKAPTYKVLDVTDGDTIVIAKDGESRVRLLAMDTPEKSETRYGYVEYFGEEAWRHASALIEESGWHVRITYDKARKDQYGRDLAYVWLQDGRMLNALMVADGYAYSYTSSPKPEYVDNFLALMRQARSRRLGLWGHCS
ncbi:MAG TPA: thermonuclease family protein [Symbiobacteriaceae bacterium]|nr:thermonuclease family protein [Symbiobacteriaceae bacterium]